MADSKTNITIGSPQYPVRFSYAHFFTPVGDDDKVDKKTGKPVLFYSTQIIINKKDKEAIAAINAATAAAADEKLSGKKIPVSWKLPLRDGDEEWEEKGEHLKGHYFFNCKSKSKPSVVSAKRATEEDRAEWLAINDMSDASDPNCPKVDKFIRIGEDGIKSGDYGRVSVNFYYYDVDSKGIAAGLNNVQKLKDGDALGGGKTNADDDFGDIEEGFDD